MPKKMLPRVYCTRCDKWIDKYYYGYHCNTKKHLLGLSKNLENQLRKDYKHCVLIFN
ncbi:MAG: hypothetical protein ACJATM_001317 [Alphaproteobacteria bacterium]|jgi:hypothetical protein